VKNAPAVFGIFVHHPQKTFSTVSAKRDIIVKYVHP